MKLVQSIMTKNPCYTAGRKITVKGLMLHSVGCPQPKAMAFISDWNRPTYKAACVHGFIDANDGTVYQTLPWNHRGWHAGGSANNTHIGVEMCEPDCIKYKPNSATFTCSDKSKAQEMVKRTYDAAVELFAMLCKEYNLDPLTQICSHAEGYKKRIAANHGDPEHLWNQLGMGYTMDGFRQDVKKAMGGSVAPTPAPQPSFKPYIVRINCSLLNVRAGAGTSYKVNTTVIRGEAFTIVEEKDGWGRLKSGAGWICLKYTIKV